MFPYGIVTSVDLLFSAWLFSFFRIRLTTSFVVFWIEFVFWNKFPQQLQCVIPCRKIVLLSLYYPVHLNLFFWPQSANILEYPLDKNRLLAPSCIILLWNNLLIAESKMSGRKPQFGDFLWILKSQKIQYGYRRVAKFQQERI